MPALLGSRLLFVVRAHCGRCGAHCPMRVEGTITTAAEQGVPGVVLVRMTYRIVEEDRVMVRLFARGHRGPVWTHP